ncbi:MAG: DUF2339 domain-containing protein, partial [Acidobacteria bacterium]|nr:DUF2339 domain-containing protein [Acidobacteriota bacterium]
MECFSFLAIFAVVILSVVAWRRSSLARQETARLEIELDLLRKRVDQLETSGESAPADAVPLPAPEAASRPAVVAGPETPAEPISVKEMAAALRLREQAEAAALREGAIEGAESREAAEELAPDTISSQDEVAPPISPPEASPSEVVPPHATPPTPPSPPPPAARPSGGIEWERWLGIRGAAVVGGVVLALAALLFLKYAVEQGYFPPIVRVTLAMLAGLGTLTASEVMRRRDYGITADAVAGAGIVMLYGAVWAGHSLYHLIPSLLAFVLMVLVTGACAGLAWRHRSLVVAVLGLSGGFVAPLLLSSLRDDPIGLFGYLMLLNLGILVLSRRHSWPVLGALSLLVTSVYVALWLAGTVSSLGLGSGLAVLAAFALVFVVTSTWGGSAGAEGDAWTTLRGAGLLLPFLFSVRFSASAEFGEHLVPLGVLLALLAVAAVWLARRLGEPWLRLGAAAGVALNGLVWLGRSLPSISQDLEVVAVLVGWVVIFHLDLEISARAAVDNGRRTVLSWLPAVGILGTFLPITIFGACAGVASRAEFWPWMLGVVVLFALALRQASLGVPAFFPVAFAMLVALGLVTMSALARLDGSPSFETILALTLG